MRHVTITEHGGKSVIDFQLYNSIINNDFVEVFIQEDSGFCTAIQLNKDQISKLIESLIVINSNIE